MLYLDNAATGGRKPDAVVSAVTSAAKLCANPGRSGHKLSLACAASVLECRKALSDFFGGYGFERTVFTKNCTEALNIALFGLLSPGDDYSVLAEPRFRALFGQYAVAVGSTGNLGLSIGIMSAQLGFKVTVHMSADARQWKKDMLRGKGVTVVEYADDYSKAVDEGRRQAAGDPTCHFVDDENSRTLFLGYAVAAERVAKQLEALRIPVDQDHPLFVYLPCGVGGGPGGVAFGLKLLYGDSVHCFFAEPTHAPCMTLGLVTGLHDQVCVQDFGIDNHTAADGLAVGRPSRFVGRAVAPLLSGCYTVTDERLYRLLRAMADTEHIRLEPSALAGVPGMGLLCGEAGAEYVRSHGLDMARATHIAWATGGSMVPPDVWQGYYDRGAAL